MALFSEHAEERGIFLLSLRDSRPRLPILIADGDYVLHYKAYATGFPLLRFSIGLKPLWKSPDEGEQPTTAATLISPIE